MLELIAFDADDTLWQTEDLYARTQDRFARLLALFGPAQEIMQKLSGTELRNLELYGYGIKAFMLSMLETALDVSGGQISGRDLQTLISWGRDMLTANVELIEDVEKTLAALCAAYPLMIITKGDLRDQESKLTRSGLRRYFRYAEIVSDKTRSTYESLLAKYRVAASSFLMVGNSLRSDILPVVALGGLAVHIPYHLTWAHEAAALDRTEQRGYFELDHIGLLPALVKTL
jgi:putative hydrolase of the HAD superfamily